MKKIHQSLYEKTVLSNTSMKYYVWQKYKFSRLRKSPVETLTPGDIAELSKWNGRAKSDKGLKDIIDALNELENTSQAK